LTKVPIWRVEVSSVVVGIDESEKEAVSGRGSVDRCDGTRAHAPDQALVLLHFQTCGRGNCNLHLSSNVADRLSDAQSRDAALAFV
jgi:hypothetical protein